MPSAEHELRRAMRDLLEAGVSLRRRPPPGYAGLRELYGSNAAIADAAGLPTAAQAAAAHRARYPHARPATLSRIRIGARRERQSFLRNLQRYATGQRRPAAIRPLLERLRRAGMKRYEAGGGTFGDAATLEELARLLVARGATIPGNWEVLLLLSSDERWRQPAGVKFFPPRAFATAAAEGHWGDAADAFFSAWGDAYGIGAGVIASEAIGLEIVAGLDARLAPYGP
jgi:hypothetical protein